MKCKYWKTCENYDANSNTCNKTGGMYYDNSPAGCYIKMEKKDENQT